MNRRRIIFRVDANTGTGMGHLARCMAMAEMLKGDFETLFVCADPLPGIVEKIRSISEISAISVDGIDDDCSRLLSIAQPEDIIVLDGYPFAENYQRRLRDRNLKFVYIDDLVTGFYFADVIINHSEGVRASDYHCRPDCNLYLGLRYAMLRKSFFSNKGKKVSGIKKIFLSMGAADINNLSARFIEALISLKEITEIHLLAGSLNQHLYDIIKLAEANNGIVKVHVDLYEEDVCNLIKNCDLAICASGNVALECCAVGIPLIIGLTAPNQNGIYKTLIEKQAAMGLGDITTPSESEIARKLIELLSSRNHLEQMPLRQRQLIDGKSPERIRKVINELAGSELSFRQANELDVDLYLSLAKDEWGGMNYFNQQMAKSDHRKWFLQKLTEEKCRMYIFYKGNLKARMVIIDKLKSEAVIGISIGSAHGEKSPGKEMLIRSCRNYFNSFPEALISACIKKEDTTSVKTFGQAGFVYSEELTIDGIPHVKLKKVNDE